MSLLSRLFGGGGSSAAKAQSEDHKGFTITPRPEKVDGGYRIGAMVEKDGKQHMLIRADTLMDMDLAVQASVEKAKQAIDHMGERIFG